MCFSSDKEIKSIKNVAPEKRKCFYPEERGLQLFQRYSFNNCLLECYLVLAANVTHCVPWYLPRPGQDNITTCDPWQTNQFLKEISSMDQAQCGHCLSDCDTVKYAVASTSSKFKYEDSSINQVLR